MSGACSTWKEEERPEIAVATRLSDRGDFSMTGIPRARNLTILCRERESISLYGAAIDFEVDQAGAAPALGRFFVTHLAAGKIIRQADVVRQPAVYQNVRFAAKFLAPGSILGLLLEDFLQAGRGVCVGPRGHLLFHRQKKQEEIGGGTMGWPMPSRGLSEVR